jgi:hypothetical protein
VNTRLIAARVLSRVLQDGQSLTAALDFALPAVESAKDRAFIQALCYGVCRAYHRLDFILSELLDKPLKDQEVKALALVGLYQPCRVGNAFLPTFYLIPVGKKNLPTLHYCTTQLGRVSIA